MIEEVEWGVWLVGWSVCYFVCDIYFVYVCCVFQAAKLAKMKTPPSEMFLSEINKYSKFDENVRQPLALQTFVAHILQAGVQGLLALGQWVSCLEWVSCKDSWDHPTPVGAMAMLGCLCQFCGQLWPLAL